jgi:hypothetical protein
MKSNPRCGLDRAFKILLLYVALISPIAFAQTNVCSFVHNNTVKPPVVLVLQPQVHIWKDKGFSLAESPGATDAARTGFQAVSGRVFEDGGHKLLLNPTVQREWEETPPNDYAVSALNDHFNSMVRGLGTMTDSMQLSCHVPRVPCQPSWERL